MEKTLLSFLCLLLAAPTIMAQRIVDMREHRSSVQAIDLANRNVISQIPRPDLRSTAAVTFTAIGSSYNIYTMLNDHQNMVNYDADLDAVVFTHRQDAGTAGGSGGLSFDRSTDGGATWQTNFIVTPDYNAGTAPADVDGNRYPSATIWNPAGNTDPANAYVVMTGPALSVSTTLWGYTMAHSANLDDGSNVSEEYTTTQSGLLVDWLPASTVTHPTTGELWSISGTLGGPSTTDDYTYVNINRGVFNTTTNKVDWTLGDTILEPAYSLTVDPTDATLTNLGSTGWSMGFSPDGVTGYAVYNGSLTSSITETLHPQVLKSTDGGDSWNALPSYDFTSFPVFDNYLVPTRQGVAMPYFSSMDCAVDNNGRLHLFSSVLPRSTTSLDSAYYVWIGAGTEGLFHLTVSDGTDWTASIIDSVLTEDGAIGAQPHPARTNISRSQDGSKIFFTWSASDPEIIGTNDLPNVLIKGYDVASDEYTFTRTPTEGTAVDGTIFFPTASPFTRDSGTEWDYEIPIVFTIPTATDLDQTDHYYLGGAGFNDDEFGLAAPPATADFSFAVTDAMVAFTNLSLDANNYIWDFGDGSPLSGLTNPSHTYGETGTYNVCLTAQNDGTPDTDDETCKDVSVVVSGLQDPLLDAAVSLFPSPTSGLVNITVNGNFGELSVAVFNMLGEQVLANTVMQMGANATLQLNLNNAPNGNYLVKITGEQGITTRTLVVSH